RAALLELAQLIAQVVIGAAFDVQILLDLLPIRLLLGHEARGLLLGCGGLVLVGLRVGRENLILLLERLVRFHPVDASNVREDDEAPDDQAEDQIEKNENLPDRGHGPSPFWCGPATRPTPQADNSPSAYAAITLALVPPKASGAALCQPPSSVS